jgi:hypothetical protein
MQRSPVSEELLEFTFLRPARVTYLRRGTWGNQTTGLRLFARVSPKKGVLAKPPKKKFVVEFGDEFKSHRKPRKSINRLEFLLIRSCLLRNSELINAKEAAFHAGLIVPGYLNHEQGDLSDSAVSLAKMLGIT